MLPTATIGVMSRRRIFIVLGTRPEAIKLAPVVRACRARPDDFETIVCLTGQHRELVRPLVDYFDLRPDVDLDLMSPGQSLAELTSRCLTKLDAALAEHRPDVVVVQGDTTTAMTAAMAAFFRRVPVVHVEAGLRTGDMNSPFPEEFNRRVVTLAAALHCAPTERAAANLRAEGVADDRILVTGNTAIDALLWTRDRLKSQISNLRSETNRPLVLITAHRRESFGPGFDGICTAVAILAGRYPNHRFVWPLHPNPQASEPVRRALGDLANVELIAPLEYPDFVRTMDAATLILTDSGGVQEEAPSLGKPVLVLREETERPEGIAAGCAELVGTNAAKIIERASDYLDAAKRGETRPAIVNPYGDGRAAERIVDALYRFTIVL